jgi:hypothetical protein
MPDAAPIDATDTKLPPEKLGFSIMALCDLFTPKLSRARIAREISEGRLAAPKRLGNRAIITRQAAIDWLNNLSSYHADHSGRHSND